MDVSTSKIDKERFARVAIEIDTSFPQVPGAIVRLEGVKVDGVDLQQFWQRFEYEHIHLFCDVCGCVGHYRFDCDFVPASSVFNNSIGTDVLMPTVGNDVPVAYDDTPIPGPWINTRARRGPRQPMGDGQRFAPAKNLALAINRSSNSYQPTAMNARAKQHVSKPRVTHSKPSGATETSGDTRSLHDLSLDPSRASASIKRARGKPFAKMMSRGKEKLDTGPGRFGALGLLDNPTEGFFESGSGYKSGPKLVVNGFGSSGASSSLGIGLSEANLEPHSATPSSPIGDASPSSQGKKCSPNNLSLKPSSLQESDKSLTAVRTSEAARAPAAAAVPSPVSVANASPSTPSIDGTSSINDQAMTVVSEPLIPSNVGEKNAVLTTLITKKRTIEAMRNDSKNPKSGGKAKKNSPKKISLKPYSMHDSDKSTNASNSIAVPVDNDLGINHSLVNGQSAPVSAGVVDCVPACSGSGGELLALDARDQIDLVSSQIDVIPTADQSILYSKSLRPRPSHFFKLLSMRADRCLHLLLTSKLLTLFHRFYMK